jgi:UDP:flavonoid glycosyltransferase YjiC (YdhE family)
LFVFVGALGHVHPMVPLALAMIENGHTVRWATSPDAGSRLASVGIDAIAVGPGFDEVRAEYFRRYPEAMSLAPADRPDHTFPRLFGEVAAEWMLDGVLAAAREWRPDLVVQDQAALAAPIAAAAIGVPGVTHGYGSLIMRHRIADASDRVAPLWRLAGLEPRPYGGTYDHLYIDIYPKSLQSADLSHIHQRQPLRPVAFDEVAGDDASVWPGERDERPLIYLTLGTVHRDSLPLRTACEGIASLDVRLLVTVGPAGNERDLGRQPSNVRVRRYVPQTRVFEECAVVASHAGSGTFLAAVGRGIPQLCLPQAADQFINAAACTRVGVGLTILPEEATPTAVAEAVSRLLSDGTFRIRAGEVAGEISAMPSPAEVAAILVRLL